VTYEKEEQAVKLFEATMNEEVLVNGLPIRAEYTEHYSSKSTAGREEGKKKA